MDVYESARLAALDGAASRELGLRSRAGDRRLFTARIMRAADAPALAEFQRMIYASISDEELYGGADDEAELASLAERELVLGVFYGGRLSGITSLIFNHPNPEHIAVLLGWPRGRCLESASMCFSAVAPDCRGWGMQAFFMRSRDAAARACGASEALITVSPNNPYSMRNVTADGYAEICRAELYGGKPRCVLLKRL